MQKLPIYRVNYWSVNKNYKEYSNRRGKLHDIVVAHIPYLAMGYCSELVSTLLTLSAAFSCHSNTVSSFYQMRSLLYVNFNTRPRIASQTCIYYNL